MASTHAAEECITYAVTSHNNKDVLQVAFPVGSLQGYMTQLTKFQSTSECSAAENSGVKLVGW
jgi:hypothetical protein